jgi:spectinomycin phosphotransferase
MREPPTGVSDAAVLAAVRHHWRAAADEATHLPVGFGAHHWRISSAGSPEWFATLDRLEPRRTRASLERAYASAAALAESGLEFVAASTPTADGRFTVPLGDGSLSLVPWIAGADPEPPAGGGDLARRTAELLDRLHAVTPPAGTPVWRPAVEAGLPERLAALAARPWATGPLGEPARQAIRASAPRIERWTDRYGRLVEEASLRPWVVTHGEPHALNAMDTASGLVLVDWESVALAPRERDLRAVIERGHPRPSGADEDMLELFDLDWRLDEVSQYSTWFSSPHAGGANDAIAYDDLRHELNRPDWTPAARRRRHSPGGTDAK